MKPDGPSRFFANWDQEAPPAEDPRRRSRRPVAAGAIATALTAGAVAIVHPSSSAQADPSASDWYRLRMCESSDNYSINTGNGHYGAYQFDLPTWQSVGGTGYPYQASPGEQDARALILYRERGWQPWQCASILGLQEDADARSGRISDIHVPTGGGSGGTSQVPPFPGSGSFQYGDWNSDIKQFQDQMHTRGFFPPGTGQFGPLTLAMVKRLQLLNGLPASGLIGPQTWALAWTGKYSLPAPPSTGGAPAYPSSGPFQYGDSSGYIKQFQDQMNRRGFLPPGTGYYGSLTLALVRRLQLLNHLPVSGYIGPLTWQAAWTGSFSLDSAPSAAPAFPGTRNYHYGDWNNVIKAFQNQMHARGYFPVGTGQYGPVTLAMTEQLQRLNGLVPNGELGPNTWRLAWTGRYQQP